ncbi:SIR2 family NAD-dependent protein deacylase [Methylobacter svalbardensis]|uniref:SIR2 family NAD-dependent protein deacylase n=1 Tax=Methylobacter svalbardensis TaxID=3080016 RepID=UPI0030EDF978
MIKRLTIQQAATAIVAADTILITAGAGMGVDSGLPDFRGQQGFWKTHPQYAAANLTFIDLANPIWFEQDPARAWGFYGYRYQLYQQTHPHPGFALLKRWQDNAQQPGFVVTSNVDGQFQKAGFSEERIYECHGAIHYLQCTASCKNEIWTVPAFSFDIEPQQLLAVGDLPLCPYCGEPARPNVLMFGDHDWLSSRSDQQGQQFYAWKNTMMTKKVVTIELGAGSTIGGIRRMGEHMSGTLIRINHREAEGPPGTISLAMGALEALQAIDAAIQSQRA